MSQKKEGNPSQETNNPKIPSMKREGDTQKAKDPKNGASNSEDLKQKTRLKRVGNWLLYEAHNWVMIILTGVLVWFTQILSNSTKDMAEANQDMAASNRVTAKASLDAAQATKDAANANWESAKVARQTIEATERLTRIQMRPQLVRPGDFKDFQLASDKELQITFTLENIGKSAALEFGSSTLLNILDTSQVDTYFRRQFPKILGHSEMSFAQGMSIDVTRRAGFNPRESQVEGVKNGRLLVCIWIVLRYTDSWHTPYRDEIKMTYAPKMGSFVNYVRPN